MKLLESPRQVTSVFHLQQVQRLLEFDGGRELDSVLVYASVELRAAIERTLFELMYLVRELEISEADIKRARSIRGLDALLREADNSYTKTMEFTRLVSETTPGTPSVAAIDTGYLRRRWQDLSEYCHLQFRPDRSFESPERAFQRKGFALLREVLDRFEGWYRAGTMGLLKRSSMPEETRGIYDEFVAGSIDADQARRMLSLSEPILRRRRDSEQ